MTRVRRLKRAAPSVAENPIVLAGFAVGTTLKILATNKERVREATRHAKEAYTKAYDAWKDTPTGDAKDQAKIAVTAAEEKLREVTPGVLLKEEQVDGSVLENTVEKVLDIPTGLGFDFDPGLSIDIAQFIGDAAVFLGPAVAVIMVGLQRKGEQDKAKLENQKADVRQDIRSHFHTVAKDLELQVEKRREKFESALYSDMDEQIKNTRKEREEIIGKSNKWLEQLSDIRYDLDTVLRNIRNMVNEATA